jgi:hypothetical protein
VIGPTPRYRDGMRRVTASRVIGMWTRAMLDEVDPDWRTTLPAELCDPTALRGTEPYIAHEDMTALWPSV